MVWFKIFLVGLFILSKVSHVSYIGKPREPVTPEIAAVGAFINFLIVLGILYYL
jgi:hypothetical protein